MCKNRGNGHKQSSHTTTTATRLTYGGNMATRTRGGHTQTCRRCLTTFGMEQDGAFQLLGSIRMQKYLDHHKEVASTCNRDDCQIITLISDGDMFEPLSLFDPG